jgi:hypothetical protein
MLKSHVINTTSLKDCAATFISKYSTAAYVRGQATNKTSKFHLLQKLEWRIRDVNTEYAPGFESFHRLRQNV